MRMTSLEWRYLQRIALDHPYFDTHELPLTEKEAKAIVKANIGMTGKEFVDSIYAKLGMTRPEEKKERFAWLRNMGELFTVPPIRKIAIAVLVVFLMMVFFVATPTGRAIAENVIQYIVTLFDDGSIAINHSDNETTLLLVDAEKEIGDSEWQDGESDKAYVSSFEDFVKVTGKTPIMLPLSCTGLYYYYEPDVGYLELHSFYSTNDRKVNAYQIWDAEDLTSSTSLGFMTYDADDTIYYSIEENGNIVVVKILEDSVFSALSKDYTLDDLVEMLNER